MMMPDPFERFLGVTASAGARAILGLISDRVSAAQIEAALERQLARVYQHPDGVGVEAEAVRQALRQAARELMQQATATGMRRASVDPGSSPTLPELVELSTGPAASVNAPAVGATAASAPVRPRIAVPLHNLTDFDRGVLAVLVACGGWNSSSRARLVSLAAAYDISAQGLLHVMRSLSTYARTGGPRIGVSDVLEGQSGADAIAFNAGAPQAPAALFDRLAESLADELKRDSVMPTIKLAVFFGSATILVGIIAVRVIFGGGSDGGASTGSSDTSWAVTTQPATQPAPSTQPAPLSGRARMVQYATLPTFLGNGLPVKAAGAADQFPQLLSELDQAARTLSVEHEPGEAVFRGWQETIGQIAIAWVLADSSALAEADRKIDDALAATSSNMSALDRLLGALNPPPPNHLTEPLELWRGAWCAGTLGRVAGLTNMPPAVVERARGLLDVALGSRGASPELHAFSTAGSAWLHRALSRIIETLPVDDAAYDWWELWLSAQRALGTGERFDLAIMHAMHELLASSPDPAEPGPAANVLGRLVELSLAHPRAAVREPLLAMFDATSITSRDLWALTSLIAQQKAAGWYPVRLVVPEDADGLHRARIRDSIAGLWSGSSPTPPNGAGTAFVVDADIAAHWIEVCDAVLERPVARSPFELMQQLVWTARLVHAADELAGQNPVEASRLALEVQTGMTGDWMNRPRPMPALLPRPGRASPRPVKPGTMGGNDAALTVAFEQARTHEDRVQVLRNLRALLGSDLGPIDAATLVRLMYHAPSQEIRTLAQSMAIEHFASGPNVLLEMLDQFPDAPETELVSDAIQQMTDRPMPEPRTETWRLDGRLALVQRVLELRSSAGADMDQLVEELVDIHVARLAAIQGHRAAPVAPRTPVESAELLLTAWHDRAQLTVTSTPAPADLPALEKRQALRQHLAIGPVQGMVAQQLGLLDLLVYITVVEQPALREEVVSLLRAAASRRATIPSVLEQAVDCERTALQIWRLRFVSVVKSSDGSRAAVEGSSRNAR